MSSGYEVFLIATRPFPEKAIGTDVTIWNQVPTPYQPGLFFYSQGDAEGFYKLIPEPLKSSYKIYKSIITVTKESI